MFLWFSIIFYSEKRGFSLIFLLIFMSFSNSHIRKALFYCFFREKLVFFMFFDWETSYFFDLILFFQVFHDFSGVNLFLSLICHWESSIFGYFLLKKWIVLVFSMVAFWELLGVFWELLGASGSLWELLGPPGGLVGLLRAFWRLPGTSWGPPGASGSLRSDWKMVKIITF